MRVQKKSNLIFLVVLLAFAIFASSCKNTQKLIERGDYDEAIRYATKKLSGKKRKKEKHVRALEKAFEKATRRDMQRIAKLEKRKGSEERIVDIYRHIRKRQEMVSPLLPLLSKKGYHADFQFVKVDELETAAINRAVVALYETAQNDLENAERGNKMAARDAFRSVSYTHLTLPTKRIV